MSKTAVSKLSRRNLLLSGPSIGQAFFGLVAAKSEVAKTQQFLLNLPNALHRLPAPKYAIGQRVTNLYTIDDDLAPDNGLTVQNKGVIVGLWWNDRAVGAHQEGSDLDFYFHGWIYVVCFFELPLEPHLAPMRCPVAEDELGPCN